MGIVWNILIGLLVGVVARFVHPGSDNLGLILTSLLGIGGSMLATFLGQAVGAYQPGQPAGFIGAVVGAVLILFAYGRLRGGKA